MPSSDWPGLCQGPLLWRQPFELLWLCVVAPLVQEWALRAGLQEHLLRRAAARLGPATEAGWPTRMASVLITALVFSVLHLGAGVVAASLALPAAVLIGLVYLHTRDWFVCACAHLALNAFAWMACQPGPFSLFG